MTISAIYVVILDFENKHLSHYSQTYDEAGEGFSPDSNPRKLIPNGKWCVNIYKEMKLISLVQKIYWDSTQSC